MATDTKKLISAYEQYNKALEQQGKANIAGYEEKKKELERDTRSALQQAYIANERQAYRQGQSDRAAGITGGLAKNEALARENAYDDQRSGIKLNAEVQNNAYNLQIAGQKANTYANKSANNIEKENALYSIRENDENSMRSTYAAMLNNSYVPTSTAEAQKMADSLGLPLASIQAYVNYMKNKA